MADSTYRVAVIGTGFADRVQLPGFREHPRFEPVAVAARDAEGTRKVAERHEIPAWYTDWRDMLAAGGFDLVSIVTPPHLHLEMTEAALAAGAHVLCEKPMALNGTEAEAMIDALRASGRLGMINHEFRHLPARRRVGRMIAEGFVGDIRHLSVRLEHGWRADPEREWNWWSDFSRGGGLLGALGSHTIDMLHTWTGLQARRAWGSLETHVTHRPDADGPSREVTSDDAFTAVLDFGDGIEAVLEFSAVCDPGLGSRVVVSGTEGTLVLDDDRKLRAGTRGGELEPVEVEPPARDDDTPWLLPAFLDLLDDLAAGIDAGQSPSPDFHAGLYHQQVIDAIRLSDAVDAWVDVPADPALAPTALPGAPLQLSS